VRDAGDPRQRDPPGGDREGRAASALRRHLPTAGLRRQAGERPGRKPVRRLGFLRPFIGATFALALYVAVKSNLLQLGNIAQPGIYFFATVSFLAGFSERRAQVLLGNVAGGLGGETRK
jgi:hypothetical protein